MDIVLQHLLNTAIYLTVILLLFNLLLDRRPRSFYSYLLFFGICFGISSISYFFSWSSIVRSIVMILGALLFFFKGTVPKRIMACVLLIQLIIILEFFHGVATMILFPGYEFSELPNRIMGWDSWIEVAVIIGLIALTIFRQGKPPLVQYFDKKYVLVWFLITLNFILFVSVFTSMEFSNQMKGLIAAILLLSSGINIYFCYYLEKTRKLFEENLVITKQVEFQENKLAQNKAYLEKNNRLMHDIKKHYLEIEHALSENQLVYVKEYMKGVYKQYFENVEAVFTGNQVIDSMFFALKEQCDKEGISLQHSIHIDKKIKLDEKDLAVLLGSLFDHAVKCVKQSKQEREIMVTIKTELHHLTIVLSYAKEAPSVLPKKTIEYWENDQMIDRIIGKYHGMFEMNEEQKVGKMKVILPLEHESSL